MLFCFYDFSCDKDYSGFIFCLFGDFVLFLVCFLCFIVFILFKENLALLYCDLLFLALPSGGFLLITLLLKAQKISSLLLLLLVHINLN